MRIDYRFAVYCLKPRCLCIWLSVWNGFAMPQFRLMAWLYGILLSLSPHRKPDPTLCAPVRRRWWLDPPPLGAWDEPLTHARAHAPAQMNGKSKQVKCKWHTIDRMRCAAKQNPNHNIANKHEKFKIPNLISHRHMYGRSGASARNTGKMDPNQSGFDRRYKILARDKRHCCWMFSADCAHTPSHCAIREKLTPSQGWLSCCWTLPEARAIETVYVAGRKPLPPLAIWWNIYDNPCICVMVRVQIAI